MESGEQADFISGINCSMRMFLWTSPSPEYPGHHQQFPLKY